jgi:polyisoprenoid-binding protein YceI
MKNLQWNLDPAHSEIQFKVKHLMVTNVTGRFKDFTAQIQTNGEDFENAKITFAAKIDSVDTGNVDRDNHLRSGDFFDADNYPELSFVSSKFTKISDDLFALEGIMNIKGKEAPLTLQAEYGGKMKDPWGNTKAGFTISGKINRKDWDLNWNAALETGGWLVSDEVRLNIEIQLLLQS